MREEVEMEEGVEHFFYWNQLMVSSCYYSARVATYGASYKHYVEWKATEPFSEAQVLAEIGRAGKKLRSQEVLAAGMLRPFHLLDILRNFILFTVEDGALIKLCPRYQQYRAVQKSHHPPDQRKNPAVFGKTAGRAGRYYLAHAGVREEHHDGPAGA